MAINLRNIVNNKPVTFAAGEGGALTSFTGGIRVSGPGSLHFRVSVYFGQCGARADSLILEQTSGNNLWEPLAGKTLSPVDSSGSDLSVVSVDDAAGSLQITAHGLTEGQPIVVNSPEKVPSGLEPGKIYSVSVVDVNNIRLRQSAEGDFLKLSDVGSGSIVVTPVSVGHIVLNNGIPGDAALLPLASSVRLRVASGANQVQISQVVVTQGE